MRKTLSKYTTGIAVALPLAGVLLLTPPALAAIGAPRADPSPPTDGVLLAACPPRKAKDPTLHATAPATQPRKQDGKTETQATAPATANIRGLRSTGTAESPTAKGTLMRGEQAPCGPTAPTM